MIYKYRSKNSPFQRRSITLTIQRVQNRIQEINVYIQSLYLRLCVAASNFFATNVHGNQHRNVLKNLLQQTTLLPCELKSVCIIYNHQNCVFRSGTRRGRCSVPPAVQRVAASSASVAASVPRSRDSTADAHATMITWSIEGQPPSYHRRKPCGLKEKSSNFSQESYQI